MNVTEFFNQKTILITGATGFVGKVLIEKLLRDTNVKLIYILIRPRNGQPLRTRLKEMINSKVFDIIRDNDNIIKKLVAINGDITYDGLGIDLGYINKLQDDVNIVFHSAATIRFDDTLKRAVNINVNGTHNVIKLCQQMKNLQALVHISTAYCNIIKSNIEEKVYAESIPVEMIINLSQSLDEETFSSFKCLMNGRPSTYHYTKALAENLLANTNLPVAIIRPSIITAAYREPLPGWIDNYNGPSGFLVASGKGVLKTLYAHPDKICDIIPVDIVVNTAIVSACKIAINNCNSIHNYINNANIKVNNVLKSDINHCPFVLNCTSGNLNPMTWRQMKDISLPFLIKYPSSMIFRYPGPVLHSNRWIHRFWLNIEHTIPSLLIDILFRITGHKPILTQVYTKLHRSIEVLEHFTTNEWTFCNDNFKALINTLNDNEKERFFIDVSQIVWTNYMENYVLGVRNYLLKEDPSSLPEARKKIKRKTPPIDYQLKKSQVCHNICWGISRLLGVVIALLINHRYKNISVRCLLVPDFATN